MLPKTRAFMHHVMKANQTIHFQLELIIGSFSMTLVMILKMIKWLAKIFTNCLWVLLPVILISTHVRMEHHGMHYLADIWYRKLTTQWYIFKRRILLPIWVHFLARMLLLKVIYRLFEASILILKVIYGLFGARILLWKYIRAQNWTQLAQSNIPTQKMYHWDFSWVFLKCIGKNHTYYLLPFFSSICFPLSVSAK